MLLGVNYSKNYPQVCAKQKNVAYFLSVNAPDMNVNMDYSEVIAYYKITFLNKFPNRKRVDGCQLHFSVCGPSALQK